MSSWYTWAFDGVGGAAVVAIGIAWYQRRSMRSDRKGSVAGSISKSQVAVGNNINQSVEVHHHHEGNRHSAEWILTEPTPRQIEKEIEAALPFDRAQVAQKYLNLSVIWKVALCSISPKGASWAVLAFALPGGTPLSASDITFDLSTVPTELRAATKNSILFVKGTIKHASKLSIELEIDPEIRVVKRA
jgi:hypothetical protein